MSIQGQRCVNFLFCLSSQWDPNGGIELACIKGRSNALIKYVFFKITRPFRLWIDPRSAHMIPIHLMFFEQTRTRASIHSPIDIGELKLFGERRFMVPVSDAIPERRDVYKEIIEGYISTMVIFSENVQPDVMQKIWKAFEKAEPGWPIDVVLIAVTVNILGKSLVPTTISVFQSLDNVRLDSLESSTRQEPCCLCGKSLDQFYDAGEGITRFPCSHLFHVGCFVQRLELSLAHACPTCHRPRSVLNCRKKKLCIVNALTKPSEPFRAWPMLLMASAGWCAYWQTVVEESLRVGLFSFLQSCLVAYWDVLPLVLDKWNYDTNFLYIRTKDYSKRSQGEASSKL